MKAKDHVQVDATTVYNQLVTDLTSAEQLLDLPSETIGGDLGRATKGSAATLLAKVQLTLGEQW